MKVVVVFLKVYPIQKMKVVVVFLKVYPIQKMKVVVFLRVCPIQEISRNEGGDGGGGLFEGLFN